MATARRLFPARKGRVDWVVALAFAAGVWAVPVAGQPQPADGARSDDPLAWRRVDPAAVDVSITVDDRAAERTRRIAGRPLLQGSREIYLRSAVAADLLQASRLWQSVSRRLTLRVGARDFRFTDGSRLVSLGDREVLLPVPVLFAAGDLWLPMAFVTEILAPEAGLFVEWRPEERLLVFGQADVNLVDLRIEAANRAATLSLQCREPLSYRATSPEAGVIDLKVYGAQVDLGRVRAEQARGLILSAVSHQYAGYAVVTVRGDDLVSRYRTFTEDDGRRIVLVVEEEQIAALPEPVPRGEAELAVGSAPVDVTQRLEIRTVVIDPGHGGTEPGVASDLGLLEKDVNLSVGLALADHLRDHGLSVVLTRDDDRDLGLAERAEIANAAGGDLFISLHCNGWFDGDARGLECYFLSPAKSDWSQSVEAVENRDATAPDDVAFIVWDLVQNRYISSSSDLAEVIQAGVCRDLGLPDRGVRQAGFRVLVGAWMPAVLVEMGFLTHPEESRDLGSGRYQRNLARALGDAILAYRERVAHQATEADEEGGR